MIELQTTPILPDVLYGLDSMYEGNEIDAITHLTVKLYMPRERIRAHVDGDEPPVGDRQYRRERKLLRVAPVLDLARKAEVPKFAGEPIESGFVIDRH